MKRNFLTVIVMVLGLAACASRPDVPGSREAAYFRLAEDGAVVTVSPYDGSADTLRLEKPVSRVVCMSTSYIGFLEEIGAEDVVQGVSGCNFVTNEGVRERAAEVGYEAAPDYEKILSLRPDLIITYTVSSVLPTYIVKLRSLGLRVLILYEHLEPDPLGKASYVRLFGALTGRQEKADSAFAAVKGRYEALALPADLSDRKKVLLNIPYGDQWYIPGAENYLSQLIRDAGGEVLGAAPGTGQSTTISVEKAYALSQEADAWLHPGLCRTKEELANVHPLFGDFPVLQKPVYNNILRYAPGGGNDFWESGAAHPEWILEDLIAILHPERSVGEGFRYYLEVE
ncbi:MAG: ABC transporter substrate-binding protein [Bacteroidales bacterium]|nr:ABC transporter substrate-binding protein [Bacteroidales bacterium]